MSMKIAKWPLAIIFSLPAVLTTAGLTAAAEVNPPPTGEALFQERCAACHNARGFGTRVLSRRVAEGQAELEKREGLTESFVTLVVRQGIGSMPQIREAELSDEQLAQIGQYLEGNE